jgi:hypothetical protein
MESAKLAGSCRGRRSRYATKQAPRRTDRRFIGEHLRPGAFHRLQHASPAIINLQRLIQRRRDVVACLGRRRSLKRHTTRFKRVLAMLLGHANPLCGSSRNRGRLGVFVRSGGTQDNH